jgi:initiation factor 1A
LEKNIIHKTAKMVKNVKGGSGHKSQARKFTTPANSKQVSKTRFATEDGELYAQVVKYLGNGMCHVLCHDEITRLCHIRGKFRGRGKRDNMITNGKWVLVGIRDYESEKSGGKLENCDLLDVYSEQDKDRLKVQVQGVNWRVFVSNDNTNTLVTKEDEIIFSDEKEDEYIKLMEMDISGSNTKKINMLSMVTDTEEDEINIDDI